MFTLAKAEGLQNVFRAKTDGFSKISHRVARFSQKMKDRNAKIANFQNSRPQTVTPNRMAILVQNTVLDVVQAIQAVVRLADAGNTAHFPVAPRQRLQLGRSCRFRIKTCNKIARITRFQMSATPDLAVNAKGDTAIRENKIVEFGEGDLKFRDWIAEQTAHVGHIAFGLVRPVTLV